jgi:hypothetical protein
MRFVKKSYLKRRSIQIFLLGFFFSLLGGMYFFYSANVGAQISDSTTQVSLVDKYTQSQAHMSLPEIKNLIAKTYNTKPYGKIISTVLAQEETYKDSYYVFYHGTDNVWRLAQDVYTKLYAHFNPAVLDKSAKDFVFLRFSKQYPAIKPQDFLLVELKKNGLINDHGAMGEMLLAVNLALFGNVGVPSECSWEYFIKSRGHTNPDQMTYERIMNSFGLTHKYIKELMSLVHLYQTKEQTLLQIFVPQNVIDDIGYLAWIRGIPADENIMDWVLGSVRSKRFPKTQQSLDTLTKIFKDKQEENPLFRGLIEEVKIGKFSLNNFLHTYRNNPGSIRHINNVMARLIFTSNILLNPQSGVKIFRYSTATSGQLNLYDKRLNELIKKILSEKVTV